MSPIQGRGEPWSDASALADHAFHFAGITEQNIAYRIDAPRDAASLAIDRFMEATRHHLCANGLLCVANPGWKARTTFCANTGRRINSVITLTQGANEDNVGAN